ncbi:MAG: hypothetical protein RLZ98_1334 [Pseudomonadota bacterium]|jgi:SAM-dependent methyltransferase
MSEAGKCPICRSRSSTPYAEISERRYFRCSTCHGVHVDSAHHLSDKAAIRHYLTHENDPSDAGYRRFLSRLADPMLERVAPGSHGLDYGCGPGPALAAMLREAGHEMQVWDPFFAPDPAPLKATYDFITCTEVAEHFQTPAEEFDRLERLLAAGGWLGVMTSFLPEDAAFAGWYYHRDPTHIVFYAPETFTVIAAARGLSCEFPAPNVALMRKVR